MPNDNDLYFLHNALALANIQRGFCSPNPAVGAIIVRDGQILATGHHQGPGTPHAEADALQKLQGGAVDAVMYVTLEPCNHYGRTPPCTQAIIDAGISRVVYGYTDPNATVKGHGAEALRSAGVACEHIATPEITSFYESYRHWLVTHKPFVTAKIAMSLNGMIAGKNGKRLTVTGAALAEFTHQRRQASDAILTTAKTIISDDPLLNARTAEAVYAKPLYILDTQLALPTRAKIFSTAKSITVFHAETASIAAKKALEGENVRCVTVPLTENKLDLSAIMTIVGQDGMHDLWVEAGGACFASFMQQQLLNQAYVYVAPTWLGDGQPAFADSFNLDTLSADIHWQQIGADVLCSIRW